MTDEPEPAARDVATTRRGVLATVGATALAGCSGFDTAGSEPDLDRSELPAVPEHPDPPVVTELPITVSDTYASGQIEAVHSALASVPTPLGPEQIPNGRVRERVVDAMDDARSALTAASRAGSPGEAVTRLARARGDARLAAGTWAAIEGRLMTAAGDVAERRRDHERRRADVDGDRDYVGTDPIRATAIHATVDEWLDSAAVDDDDHGDSRVLQVGTAAGEVASGEAYLAAASELHSRHRAALPEDPPSVERTLDRAGGQLVDLVTERRGELPAEDAAIAVDGDGDAADRTAWLLNDVYDDATYPEVPGDYRLAERIVVATRVLATIGAFEQVRAAVDDGERYALESARELRQQRTAARDALERAVRASRPSLLARLAVERAVRDYVWNDDRVRRNDHRTRPSAYSREYQTYVHVEAFASAVPDAVEAARRALAGD